MQRNSSRQDSDSALVRACLGGDGDAFGRIVQRYQSLLCSLAYAAVGDVRHSEDIAQEAFVEAWRKLPALREPEKLKSWLCGIVRFKASHFRRSETRQPLGKAAELGEEISCEAAHSDAEGAAMHDQEQALLSHAMQHLPETYRETLILFYREEHSVAQVANGLDISEATVKQRLSRGRKLLQAQMLGVVEKALEQSRPGNVFTLSVLAAVASAGPPAKAAGLGAATLKAGSWFKWASVVTVAAAFSGIISTFFGLRAGLDQARTRRERRYTIRVVVMFLSGALLFVLGMYLLRYLGLHGQAPLGALAVLSQLLVAGFVGGYTLLTLHSLRASRHLRRDERERAPEAFHGAVDRPGRGPREYRSRLRLFRVPLAHVRFGAAEVDDPPVFGWVAGGDRAIGLLFAWGGVAVAPLSVGIVAVGGLGLGAVGVGLIGVGTVGIGIVGFGASAIGQYAFASLSALAWEGAFSGGFAIAKTAAIGPLAIAEQVNNDRAGQIAHLAALDQGVLWVLSAIAVLVIVPAAWYAGQVRKRMRRRD